MNHMTNTSSSVNVGDTKDRFLNINTEEGEGRRGVVYLSIFHTVHEISKLI